MNFYCLFCLPLIDKKKDCVVIAVRGTLSLEDCVTDVTADTVEVSCCPAAELVSCSWVAAVSAILRVI